VVCERRPSTIRVSGASPTRTNAAVAKPTSSSKARLTGVVDNSICSRVS
jgi:hypothetical protein